MVGFSWKYIHRFKLSGSITHKLNIVKTQMRTLSYHSKVDNEQQLYFHQHEWSSGLDINIGLHGQLSVRRGHRDHLQSATPKRVTTKQYSITSVLFSVVSPKSFYTSVVSCWLFYNCLFGNVLCHNLGKFYWEKYSITLLIFTVVSPKSPNPRPS